MMPLACIIKKDKVGVERARTWILDSNEIESMITDDLLFDLGIVPLANKRVYFHPLWFRFIEKRRLHIWNIWVMRYEGFGSRKRILYERFMQWGQWVWRRLQLAINNA